MRQKERIYRRRRPLRTFMRVLGILTALGAVFLIFLFFWLQNFIVHTQDGVRLDIPFLHGILDEIPASAIIEIQPEPTAPPQGTSPPPTQEQEELEAPPEGFVLVAGEDLHLVMDWELTLGGFGASGVIIAVNDETGMLWWDTGVSLATSYALGGQGDLAYHLALLPQGAQASALLVGFENHLMASRNPPVAYNETWIDPENEEARTYIIDLALELGRMGFDEIILADFSLPFDVETPGEEEAVVSFLQDLSQALGRIGVSLSLLTTEAHWAFYAEEYAVVPLDFAQLSGMITRFYCVLSPQTLADTDRFTALLTQVQSVLGANHMARFVPAGPGGSPVGGNWLEIPA